MDLMFQTIFQLSPMTWLLAGKMTDLVSYLCAFLEINRAANVRLVRYSLLYPLAAHLHSPSHPDIRWLLRSPQAIQSLNDPLLCSKTLKQLWLHPP